MTQKVAPHYVLSASAAETDMHLAHRKAGGLRPDVAVVAADDGVLDHLGGHQLVVDVGLPRHLVSVTCEEGEIEEEERDDAAQEHVVEDGGGGEEKAGGRCKRRRRRLSHTFDFVRPSSPWIRPSSVLLSVSVPASSQGYQESGGTRGTETA